MQQAFAVAGAGGSNSQTITFISPAPSNAVVDGPSYVAVATASSNLPVVLTVDAVSAGVCAINNGTVTFTGTGACTINANQGGNADFAPAPQEQQSFPVNPPVSDVIFRDGFNGP